jgi:glycosyltransferase involved in cell wall biosynthesis
MKRHLRIAVWHNLPSGGGKRALHGHVKGLLEKGHQIEAWCPSSADPSYLPLKDLIPEHVLRLNDTAMRSGGRWGGLLSSAVMKRRLAEMDRHCKECAAQIGVGKFDVVFANACLFFRMPPLARHVTSPSAIYLGEPFRWLYEALPRLPWVARDDTGWSPRSLRRFVADLLDTHALRIQMREEIASAEAFDRILVNSLFSRESVLRAYGLESTVCYLGIDQAQFYPSGEAAGKYVVGLGNLSSIKGPDRAIRAIGAITPAKRPELLWIGNISDARYEAELRALAVSLGVKLTIKVLVSDAELRSLLSRAALLLYTSRLEPFGLAPLEANACGTPVVAIAEGGVRETIQSGTNGLLVNGDDPANLARAMERLLDDPVLAATMRRQAAVAIDVHWSMPAAINRLESLLYDLADRQRPNSMPPSS